MGERGPIRGGRRLLLRRTDEPAPHHDDVPAVRELHVTIPLRPQVVPAKFPAQFARAVQDEYAIQYLAQLGASGAPENVALVLQHLPLEDCAVAASWRVRGSLSDMLSIDLYPPKHGPSTAIVPVSPAPRPSTVAPVEAISPTQSRIYCVGPVCLSFDDMKRKFLLPFCQAETREEVDVLVTYGMKRVEDGSAFVQVPVLTDADAKAVGPIGVLTKRASQRRHLCHRERSSPPDARPDTIISMHKAFFLVLPLSSLGFSARDDREQALLLDLLQGDDMLALVQAVSLYLYVDKFVWLASVDDPKFPSPPSTPQLPKVEMLFVDIVTRFEALRSRLERENLSTKSRTTASLLLPLLLLALRVDVETIYRVQYPQSFAVAGPTMQFTLREMNKRVTELLDPDTHLSRLAILETSCSGLAAMSSPAFQQRQRTRRLRDQFFKTSEALHSVFPTQVGGRSRQIASQNGGANIARYAQHLDRDAQAANDREEFEDARRQNSSTNTSVETKLKLLRVLQRSTPVWTTR